MLVMLVWTAGHHCSSSGRQFQPRARNNKDGLSKHGAASRAGQRQVGWRKAVLPPALHTAALSSIAGCAASCHISVFKLIQLNGRNIIQVGA